MTHKEILIAHAIHYKGDWQKMVEALRKVEKPSDEDLAKAQSCPFKTVTLLDSEYPVRLKNTTNPPLVLFYRGNLDLLANSEKSITIAGTRNPSSYGKEMTEKFVSDLVKAGYTIITSMALGVSSIAIETVLKQDGKVIVVLGCGIDTCYPHSQQHLFDKLTESQLVVSEYPAGVEPTMENMAIKNKITTGIGKALLITEEKSPSTSESFALCCGREIFCVPDRADQGSECNKLIANGAVLTEKIEDILEVLEH